jgi:hypothetical protein
MQGSKNIKELERRYQACQRKLQEALSVEMRNAIADILRNQGRANDTLLKIVLPEMHMRFDQVQDSLAHKAFLDSLFFPEMFARHRNIAPPSAGTYEWVFDQDGEENKQIRAKLGQFKCWLSSDEPYFWVNGKAGSGKSSLMSFIESDKRTEDELKIWSGSHELYMFSFFFWRPGSDLQKSITGLLQSLLYQLVKKKPAVMSAFVSSGVSTHTVWTETTLLRAIAQVLPKYHQDRLFFLIDGLDEFEGQYLRLLDTLFKLQSGTNVKTCFSSRPEAALIKRLASFPSICLQDINYRDISLFVKQSLEPHRNQDTADDGIVADVESRSEGIFSWAALVCKSLVSGYEAGDDKATIQRRLNSTPAGLEALFSHMFSNVEDVHRESLSVYFSLLKWNVASVALVTVLLHKEPFETLQQYGNECQLVKHRILVQSKGLVELDDYRWHRDRADDLRWALVLLTTGQIRTDFVHASELTDPNQYHDIRLEWVHRSAYDCIMNSPSRDLASSLQPENELDLARRTLAAVLWLAKHVPHIVITPRQPKLYTRVFLSIKAMGHLLRIPGIDLNHEVEQTLDELFDALLSSLYVEDGTFMRKALSERLKLNTNRKQDTFIPLSDFWEGVADFPDPDRYILPRFERLEQSAHPHRLLDAILMSIAYSHTGPCNQLPAVWHRAVDFLAKQNIGQSRAALIQTYTRTGLRLRPHITSSFDCGTEYRLVHALGVVCTRVGEGNDDAWWNTVTQLLNVCEAWEIYHGIPTESQPGFLSPLQMQVPQSYANVHLGRDTVPDSFKARWRQRRTLRLLCLDPKQLSAAPLQTLERQRLEVIGVFNISEQCSQAIGDLVVDNISPFGDFAESMGQGRCLQLILNDIWEDPDAQLDAWQRLCVRAYVKKWFKYLWIRRAREQESGIVFIAHRLLRRAWHN